MNNADIKTIGELKAYLMDKPDDAPIYLFGVGVGSCVYDISVDYRIQDCTEHNGRKWTTKESLIIEIDG